MNKLRVSGYDAKYRRNLLEGALKRRNQMDKMIENGQIVRYRSREELLRNKNNKRGKYASNWFMNDKYASTITIPSTQNSRLANKIQKQIGNKIINGGLTKVI